MDSPVERIMRTPVAPSFSTRFSDSRSWLDWLWGAWAWTLLTFLYSFREETFLKINLLFYWNAFCFPLPLGFGYLLSMLAMPNTAVAYGGSKQQCRDIKCVSPETSSFLLVLAHFLLDHPVLELHIINKALKWGRYIFLKPARLDNGICLNSMSFLEIWT